MRIEKGDCLHTDIEVRPDLIITDPPYFVLPKGKGGDTFSWDCFESEDAFFDFTRSWFNKYYTLLKDDSFMFIFWSQKYFKEGMEIFKPDRVLIWQYPNLINGGGKEFAYDYEPIFVIKKGKPKLIPGRHNCVLNFVKPQSNFNVNKAMYPTQKPVLLIEHLLSIVEGPITCCLDMFVGGGTTMVACKNKGIDCIGIDKEQRAIDTTKKRLGLE